MNGMNNNKSNAAQAGKAVNKAQLQAALGELSQTVSEGLHDESPGGERLTNQEKHAIHEALESVDHQSEFIKRVIAL